MGRIDDASKNDKQSETEVKVEVTVKINGVPQKTETISTKENANGSDAPYHGRL